MMSEVKTANTRLFLIISASDSKLARFVLKNLFQRVQVTWGLDNNK